MPKLTHHQLIDEETGKPNMAVFKALARRRAIADFGAITPCSLRASIRYYAGLLPEKQCAWRQQHGLPVETILMTPFGKWRDGVCRSAF